MTENCAKRISKEEFLKAMKKYIEADVDRLVNYAVLMSKEPTSTKYDNIIKELLANLDTNKKLYNRAKVEENLICYVTKDNHYAVEWLTPEEMKMMQKIIKQEKKSYTV